MLVGSALGVAVAGLPSRPFKSTFFRVTTTAYVQDPLGKNRPIRRNRFNVAGGARLLYLAQDRIVCLQETQAFAWPASAVSIIPIVFDLCAVIDLNDPAVKAALQTTDSELRFNFRSVPLGGGASASQQLGEACAASGRVDGLLFESCALPSVVPPHLTLTVVEAGLAVLGSTIEALDPVSGTKHVLP